MAIINWKDCYATNVEQFDKEHQELVLRVNRLYEAIRDKTTEKELPGIIADLTAYTLEHFRHEEELMTHFQYPELEEHRREHTALHDRVMEFKAQSEGNDAQVAPQLFAFLREWLLHHIVEVDGRYGEFFRDKGIR